MHSDLNTFPDAAIIRRVLDDDVNAFEQLIERHKPLIFGIVSRHIPAQDVENVAQDIFVQSFRRLSTYSARKPFSHWLSRVAVRRCCDYWRRQRRNREVAASTLGDQHVDWMEAVTAEASREEFEKQSARREAAEVLDWALGRLKPDNRMALSLFYLESRSIQETADLMGWSLVGTRVRIMRARRELRKILEPKLFGRKSNEKSK